MAKSDTDDKPTKAPKAKPKAAKAKQAEHKQPEAPQPVVDENDELLRSKLRPSDPNAPIRSPPDIRLRTPLADTSLSPSERPPPPYAVGATSEEPAPSPSGLPAPTPSPAEIVTGSGGLPAPPGSSNPVVVEVVDEEWEGLSEKEREMRWVEMRKERLLAGERRRAQFLLGEVLNENMSMPLRLSAIRIFGARSTRTSFLHQLTSPYLSPAFKLEPTSNIPSDAQPGSDEDIKPRRTLSELLQISSAATERLSRFELFSAIDARLARNPSPLARPDEVELQLLVKEMPRIHVNAGAQAGDGEGNATFTGRLRNVFGGAETLSVDMSVGNLTKSAFQARLEAPFPYAFPFPTLPKVLGGKSQPPTLIPSPDHVYDVSAYAAEKDLSSWASCRERVMGGQARLKTLSRFGYHEIAYDAVARDIHALQPHASLSMREAAGQTVKSAISHNFVRDSRDDPFLPTRGSYLRLHQEYAGLGGDANHLKADVESSFAASFGKHSTFTLGLRGGALFPFNRTSLFSDRFTLGGPNGLRMYRLNELGPKDNGDYLGGDLFWAAGLSWLSDIPKKPDWPLKSHVFLNAGRLVAHDPTRPYSDSIGDLLQKPTLTAGLGLIYRHSAVRVELNFGLPLAAARGDGYRKGFQVGLGVNFL